MKLRLAACQDARDLATIEQLQPQAAGWGKKGFETELAQPCARIWCAETTGELVGFVAARFAADMAEILNVAVHPAHIRAGVGRALLDGVLTDLKKQGVSQVSLEVSKANIAACRLYMQAGFSILNTRKNFYGSGQDGWIMGKTI